MDEVTESIADILADEIKKESAPESEEVETEAISEDEGISEEAPEEVVEATIEEDSEESEEPETVFQAPEHWSSDDREVFQSLPPEAQEILIEKEASFQRGYQEKVESIAAITDALEPWKDALAQRGVTADQAIRTLFAAQHSLDTNPLQGILQIAQSYGVTDQLREQFSPNTDDDFTDPEIKALRQEIADLKNLQTQQVQEGQNQRTQAVQQQIDNFKTATDADGNLKHPHFESVKLQMAPLVQSGKSMEEAYNEVVWTVPEYRESQIASIEKKREQKSEQEQAEKVKKAKKAARGVKTSGKADVKEDEEALSLHDQLSAAFRQHSA